MKKTAGLIIFFFILAVVLGACHSQEEGSTEASMLKWVEMIVARGTIQSSFSSQGIVSVSDEALQKFTINYLKEDENKLRSLYGRTFSAGEMIWTDHRALRDGIVVQISFTNQRAELTLLDESLLRIRTLISKDQAKKIDYLTQASIELEGRKSSAVICSIGYIVENDQIEVILSANQTGMLPGDKVNIQFILGEKTNCMFALKEAIGRDPDGTSYVYVLQPDGQYIRKDIICGEEFIMTENGYEWTFLEILSGVADGSRIRFQIAEDDPSAYLYEEFFQ